MDGGARSSDNADLARGHAQTVIVSPMGTTLPETNGGALIEQIALLESAGRTTYLVEPDKKSRGAKGANPLLPETRIPAAEPGRSQGNAIAEDVARL
jgi:NTE family protein